MSNWRDYRFMVDSVCEGFGLIIGWSHKEMKLLSVLGIARHTFRVKDFVFL